MILSQLMRTRKIGALSGGNPPLDKCCQGKKVAALAARIEGLCKLWIEGLSL
jgi:hypothetical protein